MKPIAESLYISICLICFNPIWFETSTWFIVIAFKLALVHTIAKVQVNQMAKNIIWGTASADDVNILGNNLKKTKLNSMV
jgi:hypothetical protein